MWHLSTWKETYRWSSKIHSDSSYSLCSALVYTRTIAVKIYGSRKWRIFLIQSTSRTQQKESPTKPINGSGELLQHVGQSTGLHLLSLKCEWNKFKIHRCNTAHTEPGSCFSSCISLNSNPKNVVWFQGFAYLLSFSKYWNILQSTHLFPTRRKKKSHTQR